MPASNSARAAAALSKPFRRRSVRACACVRVLSARARPFALARVDSLLVNQFRFGNHASVISRFYRACFVLVVFAISAGARAQSTTPQITTQPMAAQPGTTYPDSQAGLKQLATDILNAQKANDGSRAQRLLDTFVLPNFRQWYAEKFTDMAVERVVPLYTAIAPRIPAQLASVFITANQQDFRNVVVVRYEDEQDACLNASPQTFAGVASRRTHVPLYELRFTHGDRYMHLFAFAYVDGAFRFVLTPDYNKPAPNAVARSDNQEAPLRVGATMSVANLVCRVQPIYPQNARMNHVSGTVRFHVIVGKDGSIRDMQVVSGPDALIGSARDAVSRWRYRPTLLNGEPVEIDTTIDVIYSLNY